MKKLLVLLAIILGTPVFAASVFDSYSSGDVAEIQEVELVPTSYAPAAKIDTPNTTKITATSTTTTTTNVQNASYQSAIQNLDAAQAELRQELAVYNQKYSAAKTKYDSVKDECNSLKKQIKSIEKKIKSLEKTKQNIGKNLT